MMMESHELKLGYLAISESISTFQEWVTPDAVHNIAGLYVKGKGLGFF